MSELKINLILLAFSASVLLWSMYFTFNRRIKKLEIEIKDEPPCWYMDSKVVRQYKPCMEPCYKWGEGICYRPHPCHANVLIKREKIKSNLIGFYKKDGN